MMSAEDGGALVIHPDGEVVTVDLRPGGNHLALMREVLDCRTVDLVCLTERLDMWLDDEGLYSRPVNPVATSLAARFGLTWQHYHGPVLLCRAAGDGGSINLDGDQIRALAAHLGDLCITP